MNDDTRNVSSSYLRQVFAGHNDLTALTTDNPRSANVLLRDTFLSAHCRLGPARFLSLMTER